MYIYVMTGIVLSFAAITVVYCSNSRQGWRFVLWVASWFAAIVSLVLIGFPDEHELQLMAPNLWITVLVAYWFLPFVVGLAISAVQIAGLLRTKRSFLAPRPLAVWVSSLSIVTLPWLHANFGYFVK